MVSVRNKIVDWLKSTAKKVIYLNDTPEKIALGFSLGVFLGIFPTFGLGGILALGLSSVLRLNYASTIMGSVMIMNPVTTPMFWGLSALVGSLIFSKDSNLILEYIKNKMLFKSLGEIAIIYLSGNLIISSLLSAVCYYLVKRLVITYRKRHPNIT